MQFYLKLLKSLLLTHLWARFSQHVHVDDDTAAYMYLKEEHAFDKCRQNVSTGAFL